MIASHETYTSRNDQPFEKFDIRNFIEQLEPAKEKGKYVCPCCQEPKLSINLDTGAYSCYKPCDNRDIREALSPWDKLQAERHGTNYTPRQKKQIANKPKAKKPEPAPIPEGKLSLLMLTEPATDIPQPQELRGKPLRGLPGSSTETIYIYSKNQWVTRYQWPDAEKEKGYDKTYRQWHRLPDGTPEMRKGDEPWTAYRLDEAIAAAKSVEGAPTLLQVEGEKCVEILRLNQIAAISFQGSAWSKKSILPEYERAKQSGIGLIIFLYDNDPAGLKKAEICSESAAEVGIAFIAINPLSVCPDLRLKGDIEQILAQMEIPEFIRRLEEQIHAVVEERKRESTEKEREEGKQTSHSTTPYDLTDTEAFYKSVCQGLSLPYENCVTAGTFEGWAYRKVFPKTEWMVINSSFYKWSEENKVWQHQHEGKANKRIAEAGEDAYKLSFSEKFRWRITKPYETNNFKKSALEFCRSRLELAEALPTNTHLLGFRNCVVDLRTGERMPHRKDFYLTNIIPHDYEANKPCPEVFRQFVIESFGEELIEAVRAFTSMFLDPTAPYGRFPHLIGPSGCGKGTLGRFWSSLFGEEGSSSAAEFEDISTADARHQYLTGKRIFGFPDVGGYAKGLRAFYELVDNGPMSGRPLFSSVAYSKQWYIRFWIASVSHLQIENAGDGWMRRTYPFPGKNRNTIPDPDLWLKLQEVKSDIISWALAMPREERDRILLSPPESERVKNLTLEASLYGDSTKSFVDLCLRPSATATLIPQSLLHSWYVLYCKEHGYAPLGMSKFIGHLKTVLPHNFKERSWTPTVNGKRERIQSHFTFLSHLPKAFDMRVPEGRPDPSQPKTEFWAYFKAESKEGGIEEFEEFWNPAKTPEPSHTSPVHPVQGQNSPVSDPGQPETLTQPTCPPCPSVQPKESTLRKEDEKNISKSGVNNFADLTYNSKVSLDKMDKMDSPAVTGLQPVQGDWTAENEVDKMDSPAVTGLQPVPEARPQQNTASKSLRNRIRDAWEDDLKLGEIVLGADQGELDRALTKCTSEQIAVINDAAITVDERNRDSLWPPGILVHPQQIDDSTRYIRDAIASSDSEMITQLTKTWKQGLKTRVWAKLLPEELQALEQLVPNFKAQEPTHSENSPSSENSIQSDGEPDSSHRAGVREWKLGDEADYLGERVSVFEASSENEWVTVIRRNGEKFNAEKFILFPWKSSDRQNK